MTLPPRKHPLKRSRIKKRPRSKSERARIYGPKGFVEWIHQQPCVACRVEGFSECAHVGRFSGMGRKGPWTETVPLCGFRSQSRLEYTLGCHRMSHAFGRDWLEKKYRINLENLAAETQKSWQSHIAALIKEK